MRKIIGALIVALFFQFFPAATSAGAAPKVIPLQISNVSVKGSIATVSWTASRLASKEFYEVELTKKGTADVPASILQPLKTKSVSIAIKVEPFTNYSVRVRKSLTPKAWTLSKAFTAPGNPLTGLKVVSTTYTTAELTWDVTAGATGYDVMVDGAAPVSVTTNKVTLNNLKPGSKISAAVRAKAGTIFTPYSQYVSFATANDSPVKLIAGSISNTGFTLTWEPISGAESYNVYKDSKLETNVKTATYLVTGLLPGSSGSYKVSAVFGKSETAASETVVVTTLMDTPAAPVVTLITTNTATVTWKLDSNADSYEINVYDSLGTKLFNRLTAEKSIGSTVLTGLASSTSYTVGLTYTYGKLTSKPSPLTSFSTTKSASVTGLTVSSTTTTSLTLTWNPFSSATSYEVYRDGVAIATGIPSSLASYIFTSLAPGQTYRLGIRAVFADGSKGTGFTEIVETVGTTGIDPLFRPAITAAPAITLPYANFPVIGAALVASNGTWSSTPAITRYSYQWQRSMDGGGTYSDVLGATSSSYVVTVADNSYVLRARVSAINVNGTGISFTDKTSPVASVYNIQGPIVRGNAFVGQLLEVSDGTWSSIFPITLSYRWITSRTSSAISGAVSPSLIVPAEEAGHFITAEVTASTSHGILVVTSPSRGRVTIVGNIVLPAITGTLRVGGTLSVSTGTWLNLGDNTTTTYQWQSSADGILWNNIPSATEATYVLKVAQAGLFIRAQVFNTKPGSSAVLANSESTSQVAVLNIVNVTAPVVTGEWTVGKTLSTTTGSWSANGTFTYQWQSSSNNSTWTDIASATSNSYTLVSGDASKYVRVQVTNTSTAGSGIAYSQSRSKIGAPFNTLAPAISGTLKIGETQTVTMGTWTNTPTAYSYQWQTSSDGISWINVSGETNATYVPAFDVANLQVRVNVSAGNAVETATVTSGVINNFLPPQAKEIPTIAAGNRTVGQTLTSTPGTWPSTSSGYSYQWQKSSDNGVTWTNIAAATASSYLLTTADAGYQIRLQVSLTTNAGSSSAYSLPTVAVAPL